MKPRVLILGDTLAGLVTAWRLGQAGLNVTILKATNHSQEETAFPSLPSLCFGPHRHTDTLLRELEILPQRHSLWTPLGLEFTTAPSKSARFPNPPLPAPWHTLWGIVNFSAFPFRQRWNLLNYIEKVWEQKAILPNSLDLQTAESWLTHLGQTGPVQHSVWNPLCRFLLGTHLSHTRAGRFVNIVTRVFFQSRDDRPRIPESPNIISAIAQGLQARLEQQGVAMDRGSAIEHLQVSSEGISEVCLSNGRILTADCYVSTLPPKTLTSLLSERLLARYSVFHQMSQHSFAPVVAFHALVDHNIETPRLLLHPGLFAWTLCQATSASDKQATMVSCVSCDDRDLFSHPDEHITALALQHLERMSSHIPLLNAGNFQENSLVRHPFGFTPQAPRSDTARPSNQTPISNLFLSGSWTDTDATTELESAIISGDLCAKAISQHYSAHD
jgi:15-cis-phytoene desaturase